MQTSFDWIFSHNIGGLITKFGGANSHMAIDVLSLSLILQLVVVR